MIMTLDSHIGVEDLDHNAEGGGGLEYELIFMDGSDLSSSSGSLCQSWNWKNTFMCFFSWKKYTLFCVNVSHPHLPHWIMYEGEKLV